MNNNISSMSIQESYPDCISLSLEIDKKSRNSLRQGELNRICQSHVLKYLQEKLGLNVDLAYPNEHRSIDGFVLTVEGVRVAFIPSEDIDFEGFEIEQKCVDSSNIAADYYVPIQVDLECESASLWGFISHKDVKERGEYDPAFRTYLIDSEYLDDDLDILWFMCEFQASGEMLSERETPPDKPVEVAASTRERQLVTKLSDWFDDRAAAIYQDWKSISEFFQTPQMQSGSRSLDRVKELTICPQVNLMYRSTGKNTEELVSIIHNTSSQNDRWEAIEYLWKLDPDHPALPIYKLMDLGLFFRGEQLSLLVSIVSTKSDKLGILIRLSPNNRENTITLPSGIKLSLLGKEGDISREVIAQDSKYQCLQLIFDADFDDLFRICVTLNNNQLIKQFQV